MKLDLDKAFNSIKNIGYISFCPNCFLAKKENEPFLNKKCECGKEVTYAGPIWLGNIFDEEKMEEMIRINKKRDYKNKREIEKILISAWPKLPA